MEMLVMISLGTMMETWRFVLLSEVRICGLAS